MKLFGGLSVIRDYKLIKNSGMFDEPWYRAQYPDVDMLGMDAIEHYLFVGARLGRNPSQHFDTKSYLQSNPDVAKAGVNPLVHYVRYGRREGRAYTSVEFPALKDTSPAASPPSTGKPQSKNINGKAVFISGEAVDKPGYIYRIARYAEAFERLGVNTLCIAHTDIPKHLAEIESARFLFIWRATLRDDVEKIMHMARRKRIPTIFDIDDLMVRPELATAEYIDAIRYDKKDPVAVRRLYELVTLAMLTASHGSATTAELAWHMRRHGRRRPTFVLPNGYGADTYQLSRVHARIKARNSDGLIRIGYASGSRTHQKDFQICAEGVAKALRENENVRLVLFKKRSLVTLDTEEFECLKGLENKIEWRPFVGHADLPKEVARFDINLAPLEHGNPFVEAKSELKFFEAAIADVPTIASPTGPFKRCIQHGETGFLASTPEEWSNYIQQLIADADLRKSISREAHRRCMWHFGPMRRVDLAKTVLDFLQGGRDSARAFRLDISAPPSSPVPVAERKIIFEEFKDKPSRVSVIIPLHNYQNYIVEALESVAAQTMSDIDLIVVDDASTDQSQEITLEWMKSNKDRFNRIVLAQHVANSGLGASRNTAFDLADTLHVMALDADNKLRPQCCEKLFNAIDREGAAFAYSIIERFEDGDGHMGNRPFHPSDFIPGNGIDAMAMISKEAWSHVGGYVTHRLGWQDFDFWCRIVERGLHGVFVEEILADYRVHQKSMLRTATDKEKNKLLLLDTMERDHPWLSLTSSERDGHRT